MNANKRSLVQRTLKSPHTMILPVLMRKSGLMRSHTGELPNGGSFSGLIPEAVTTNVWRSGFHERDVTNALRAELSSGNTFVDVGAHFGYFSVIADQIIGAAGSIVAVEAMPETYGHLLRNLSGLASTAIPVNLAAFDIATQLSFTDGGIVSSSLNSAFDRRAKSLTSVEPVQVEVQTKTLDEILESTGVTRVDVMKIDAESSERQVLAGASTVLGEFKPTVFMELGEAAAPEGDETAASVQLIETMSGFGYQAYELNGKPYTQGKWTPYANVIFSARR